MKHKYSRIVGKAMLILSALCFINSFSTLIYKNTFWPFFALLCLLLVLLGFIHLRIHLTSTNKILKFFLWGVHGLSLLLLLSFIVIEALIINSGSEKNSAPPDYVVILGAGLLGDRPSLTLSQRLNEGVKLIDLIPKNTPIIVSGGQGPGEDITEAEAMKQYLVARGIRADRILKEDKSTNTSQNMLYTMKLIKKTDNRKDIKITVVTSNFHMLRSKKLAEKAGFYRIQGWSAPITPFLIPTYYVREYMAVIKSSLLD